MPVYVDALINYGWKLGPSCHMIADTLEELHQMADKIGMKRSWFQSGKVDMPHYDLVESKRKLAIKNGAVEISRKQIVERLIKHKDQRKSESNGTGTI